jgi:hypothetical protein
MTPSELRAIGAALYGPSWQRALARTLAIHERVVRYYAAGKRPIPDALHKRLVGLLYAQADLLTRLARATRL